MFSNQKSQWLKEWEKKKQNSVYLGPEVWGSMVKKYEEILLKKFF